MSAMKEIYFEVSEKLEKELGREPDSSEISSYWEENKTEIVEDHVKNCPQCRAKLEEK